MHRHALHNTNSHHLTLASPLYLQRSAEEVLYEFAPAVHLGVKLAGVHWWHKSRSHAAELTAGDASESPQC